jgi:hypothetical protein
MVDNHLNQSFLKFLPDVPEMKSTTEENMITPFPKRFVFIQYAPCRIYAWTSLSSALKEVGDYQLSTDNVDDVDDIAKVNCRLYPLNITHTLGFITLRSLHADQAATYAKIRGASLI